MPFYSPSFGIRLFQLQVSQEQAGHYHGLTKHNGRISLAPVRISVGPHPYRYDNTYWFQYRAIAIYCLLDGGSSTLAVMKGQAWIFRRHAPSVDQWLSSRPKLAATQVWVGVLVCVNALRSVLPRRLLLLLFFLVVKGHLGVTLNRILLFRNHPS